MIIKQTSYLCAFLLSFMMAGCGVYHPQTTDIPLIKGKNDLRIDAGISFIPTIHTTISYGLTNKIAIQAFGSIGSSKYFQIAPGIFKGFGNHMVMELFGGFGAGYGDAYKDANPGHLKGNYQLYFLQYDLGKYSVKPGHIDFGFGIKAGYFYSNLTDNNYYHSQIPPVADINYKENSVLLEPMAFFRVGGEKVKVSIKVGFCRIFKIEHPDIYIATDNFNVGLGINFSPKINKGDTKKQE